MIERRKKSKNRTSRVSLVFASNPNLVSIFKLLLSFDLRFEKQQKNGTPYLKLGFPIFTPILNLDSEKNFLSFYKSKSQKSEKNEITFSKKVCRVFTSFSNFVSEILFLLNYYLKSQKVREIGVSKFVRFLPKKEI